MTHADLANYTAIVSPALSGSYRGRKVYTPHAPTSGPVLLHMLNLFERYDLAGEGRTGLNTHRLVEIIKCECTFYSCCGRNYTKDVLYQSGLPPGMHVPYKLSKIGPSY